MIPHLILSISATTSPTGKLVTFSLSHLLYSTKSETEIYSDRGGDHSGKGFPDAIRASASLLFTTNGEFFLSLLRLITPKCSHFRFMFAKGFCENCFFWITHFSSVISTCFCVSGSKSYMRKTSMA